MKKATESGKENSKNRPSKQGKGASEKLRSAAGETARLEAKDVAQVGANKAEIMREFETATGPIGEMDLEERVTARLEKAGFDECNHNQFKAAIKELFLAKQIGDTITTGETIGWELSRKPASQGDAMAEADRLLGGCITEVFRAKLMAVGHIHLLAFCVAEAPVNKEAERYGFFKTCYDSEITNALGVSAHVVAKDVDAILDKIERDLLKVSAALRRLTGTGLN